MSPARADRHLASHLEQALDASLSMGREGRVLWWNRAAEGLLGPGSFDGFPRLLQAVLAGEETVRRELRVTRPDGEPVDVEVSAGPVRDETGRLTGLSAVVRDVGERKRAERALRDSEELYRTTLGNVSDAVFITDDDGRFTFICPNVDVIFGYQKHEVEVLTRGGSR